MTKELGRQQELWFKAKRFGWGWYPITWQGWAVIIMYVFSLFSLGIFTDNNVHSDSDFLIQYFPQVFILTVFMLIICDARGEKPEWRWGFKEKNKANESVLDNGSPKNN